MEELSNTDLSCGQLTPHYFYAVAWGLPHSQKTPHQFRRLDLPRPDSLDQRSPPLQTVNVVNHKGLVSAIKGRRQVELSPEQIDLIARQLDAGCRDVED